MYYVLCCAMLCAMYCAMHAPYSYTLPCCAMCCTVLCVLYSVLCMLCRVYVISCLACSFPSESNLACRNKSKEDGRHQTRYLLFVRYYSARPLEACDRHVDLSLRHLVWEETVVRRCKTNTTTLCCGGLQFRHAASLYIASFPTMG